MEHITQQLIDRFNQRLKEMNHVYHVAAGRSGISDAEVGIWSILITSEEYSQQDIAEMLSLPKQTVNSIITNMAKREFVYLEHVPKTRNRKVVRLTDKGRAYGKDTVQWIFDAEQRALNQSDPAQIQICVEMMEDYITHLKRELGIE